MKKTLSYIISFAVALLMFCTPLVTVADSEPMFCLSSEKALPGDTVDITLSIENSPGVASVRFFVYYDSEITLESVSYNSDLDGMFQTPSSLSPGLVLNWLSLDEIVGDAVFATLRFRVPEDASLGDKFIELAFDPDDIFNIDEDNVDFSSKSGKIEVVSCFHNNTEVRDACSPGPAQSGYSGDTYCLDCGEKIAEGKIIFAAYDANEDGAVDIKDVVRVMRRIGDETVEINPLADINGDGLIYYVDYLRFCRMVLTL